MGLSRFNLLNNINKIIKLNQTLLKKSGRLQIYEAII